MRGFPASLPQPPRGSQALTLRHQETAAVWAQREHGARTHLPHRLPCRPGNLLRVARSRAGFKTLAPGRPRPSSRHRDPRGRVLHFPKLQDPTANAGTQRAFPPGLTGLQQALAGPWAHHGSWALCSWWARPPSCSRLGLGLGSAGPEPCPPARFLPGPYRVMGQSPVLSSFRARSWGWRLGTAGAGTESWLRPASLGHTGAAGAAVRGPRKQRLPQLGGRRRRSSQ